VLATLSGALEKKPGVSVADQAVNAAGQQGVAVQLISIGISNQLIFNPRTYVFIGAREVVVSASSAGLRVGAILYSSATPRRSPGNQARHPPSPRTTGQGAG